MVATLHEVRWCDQTVDAAADAPFAATPYARGAFMLLCLVGCTVLGVGRRASAHLMFLAVGDGPIMEVAVQGDPSWGYVCLHDARVGWSSASQASPCVLVASPYRSWGDRIKPVHKQLHAHLPLYPHRSGDCTGWRTWRGAVWTLAQIIEVVEAATAALPMLAR